jgi:hypothetical protein
MIIDDIIKLKEIIPTIAVSDDADFNRYKGYLTNAGKWLKRELIGAELFALANAETVADNYTELKDYCAVVVAYKGYLEAIPFLDLVETETGFAVHSDQTLAPASPKRVEELRKATAASLDEAVEDLLEFLEESEAYHEDWKGSATYTLINDNYIKSLREFRKYGKFEGSRIDFIKARPALTRARRQLIEPVISQELSEQIIEQIRDVDLNEANTAIIEDLRFALAGFATGENALAESSLARVRKKLIKTPADYPLFEESDIYADYLARLNPPEETTFLNCGI